MDDSIKQIILILGGWTVIVTGVASWLSNLLLQRIVQAWKSNADKELASLREALSRDRLILDRIMSSATADQSLAHQRSLDGIDLLWKSVLELKEKFSAAVFFFGILSPKEYSNGIRNPTLGAGVKKISEEYIVDAIQTGMELEVMRPYIGEALWLRFFIYRAFLGRLGHLLSQMKDGKTIADWRVDKGLKQHLSSLLDDGEIDSIYDDKSISSIYTAVNLLESKILEETSRILSGRRTLLDSFENSLELRELLKNEKPLGA